jgi:hypothetical protein
MGEDFEANRVSEYAGVWKLLFDWQTLITGGTAIVAASIAAWPVWRQVKRLNVQSAGMARDVLARRISDIELRRNATRLATGKITTEFIADLYRGDPEGEPDVNTEWAFQAEQTVDTVVATLTSHHESRLDDPSIESERNFFIQDARALSECLNQIHAPWSNDLEDPEWNLTNDQIADVRRQGVHAEKKLVDRLSALRTSADNLDEAFIADLERLRSRLRQLDKVVIGG